MFYKTRNCTSSLHAREDEGSVLITSKTNNAQLTIYDDYKTQNAYIKLTDVHSVNNLTILPISDQYAGLQAMIPHS
jgi:hypothetical protein